MTDYRSRLLEMIDDGIIDSRLAALMCVKYMSQSEVEEMLDMNELSERFTRED